MAAIAHKEKNAAKNKNSDAAMALWSMAMYPELNKLPTTKQELYHTRNTCRVGKRGQCNDFSFNGRNSTKLKFCHDKDHLQTQLSLASARRDAVIVELKLAENGWNNIKHHSAAVDAVSLRVKLKKPTSTNQVRCVLWNMKIKKRTY